MPSQRGWARPAGEGLKAKAVDMIDSDLGPRPGYLLSNLLSSSTPVNK
jgi:hypothetical protein